MEETIRWTIRRAAWEDYAAVLPLEELVFRQHQAVLPPYRGHGMATALLRRAREQAREAGADSLELCVWAFNRAALRLYARAGFRVQYYRMEEALGE